MENKVTMGRRGVTEEMVAAYRKDGFVKVPNLLSAESAAALREDAILVASGGQTNGDDAYAARLTQQVNVWREHEILRELTLSPGIAAIAQQLTGVELRVWHDHLLSKKPHNDLATEWHQDQPYWPLEGKPKTISVWIALQDTPADMGCMSFLPGSHEMDELQAQDLGNARSLFEIAPALEFAPKVTLPLRAGDATFHNGRTAHMANPNTTDDWRIAHVTIYMESNACFNGAGHPVTAHYMREVGELTIGQPLDQTWFPIPAAEQTG